MRYNRYQITLELRGIKMKEIARKVTVVLLGLLVCMISTVINPTSAMAATIPSCNTSQLGSLNIGVPACTFQRTLPEGAGFVFTLANTSQTSAVVSITRAEGGTGNCNNFPPITVPVGGAQQGPFVCDPRTGVYTMTLTNAANFAAVSYRLQQVPDMFKALL
jgi:hypothetical protein